MNDNHYSDEVLNAYIDNELDNDDALDIIRAMASDPVLRRRVEDLQTVKQLVKRSFGDSTQSHTRNASMQSAKTQSRWSKRTAVMALAASLILTLGVIAGWLLNQYTGHDTLLRIANNVDLTGSAHSKSKNIVLQVSTKDKYRWNTILNEVENTLANTDNTSNKLRLHLVTNAQGIQMATTKHNPYADRLQKLLKKYPNFALQVCKQTLNRLNQHNQEQPELLPGTQIVPSALGEVMKRKNDGWIYIKI